MSRCTKLPLVEALFDLYGGIGEVPFVVVGMDGSCGSSGRMLRHSARGVIR